MFRNLLQPGKTVYSQWFNEYRLDDKEIKALQTCLLGIFADFRKLCDDHGIGYMMWGGSLLGTVRHEGFIPWDDDIDVMMFREDFDRFVGIMKEQQSLGKLSRLLLAIPFESKGYYFKIPKLYDINTLYESINYMGNPDYNMAGIDIFILERVPEIFLHRKIRYALYNFAYYASALCLDQVFPSPVIMEKSRKIKDVKRFYSFRRFLGAFFGGRAGMKFYLNICKGLSEYKKASPLRGIPSGTIREIFRAEDLSEPEKGRFCGYTVNIPKKYDRYLTYLYGDYMKIPPKEKREIHVAYRVRV